MRHPGIQLHAITLTLLTHCNAHPGFYEQATWLC